MAESRNTDKTIIHESRSCGGTASTSSGSGVMPIGARAVQSISMSRRSRRT